MWSGMGPGLERLKNRALFKTKKPSAKTLTDSKNNRRLPKEPLSGARLALWIKHRIEPDGGTGELLSSRNWPKMLDFKPISRDRIREKEVGQPRKNTGDLAPARILSPADTRKSCPEEFLLFTVYYLPNNLSRGRLILPHLSACWLRPLAFFGQRPKLIFNLVNKF